MKKRKDELVENYHKLVWDCSDPACVPHDKFIYIMSAVYVQEFHGEGPERLQREVAFGCRLQFVLFLHQRTYYSQVTQEKSVG